MNTMEEQEIRARLEDALGVIDPARPPARVIVGRGRRLRWYRRGGAVAGLAAIVAVGAALPGGQQVLNPITASAAASRIELNPAPTAPGVIASGTTDGQRWTITLAREQGNLIARAPGVTALGANRPGTDPVEFTTGPGGPRADLVMVLGAVRPGVQAVTVAVAGGPPLRLVPVQSMGKRWVAMVVPDEVHVTNITASGAHGDLGHAVPYAPDRLNAIRVLNWLAPGQPGPARSSVRLPFLVAGPGAQSLVGGAVAVQAGPWGRCISSGDKAGAAMCNDELAPAVPAHHVVTEADCYGTQEAAELYCVVETVPAVSRVQLRLSDGSVHQIQPVTAGADRYFAFLVSKVSITQWQAFSASGHLLGAGTGGTL
jgi:hypothetical protein